MDIGEKIVYFLMVMLGGMFFVYANERGFLWFMGTGVLITAFIVALINSKNE